MADSLETKVEYAIMAELSDAGLEDDVLLLCGLEFEEQEGSQIVIACFGGPEIVFNSGNYMMRTRVTIRSAMDRGENETKEPDPREAHRDLVQRVRAALFTETIAQDLSEHEEDFTVNLVVPGEPDNGVEGRYFYTNIELDVDCVAADFAE